MSSVQEQIESIRKELRETPHHKATDHHIGRLRAKLSMLKDRELEQSSKGRSGGIGYSVKKQGDATVVLVGPPSVGKSTLLNILTNAKSKVAPYAFTTLTVIPGMMEYKDAMIQILDVPGIIKGAEKGKGRGKEVLSVIRGADLLIIMSDVENPEYLDSISKSLENNGVRINKKPSEVKIEKKISGGINIVSNIKQDFSKETVKEISKEFRIINADITIKQKLNLEELIDSFSNNRVYVPAIFVLNKSDLKQTKTKNQEILKISGEKGTNINALKEKIFEKLEFVRVYLVRKNEKPNMNNPLIVKKDNTLKDVSQKIGEEFSQKNQKAKIWGTGAKYEGQEVSLIKQVEDGMMIRFV